MCTCTISLLCSCLFSSFFLCPSSCACSIVSHQLNNAFSFVSRSPKMRYHILVSNPGFLFQILSCSLTSYILHSYRVYYNSHVVILLLHSLSFRVRGSTSIVLLNPLFHFLHCIFINIHTHEHAHTHAHTCTHMHTHACTCSTHCTQCTHTHIHIHTHANTHTHAYIHT